MLASTATDSLPSARAHHARRRQSNVGGRQTGHALTRSAVLLGAALFATGCTSGSGTAIAPLPGSGGTFDEDCPIGADTVTEGRVIRDQAFEAYVDPEANGIGEDLRQSVSICDFYNPTGDGVFEDDSPFAGRPKPRALLVNVSAVWCQPCKLEASEILPEEYELYGPQGLEILMVLADSQAQGVAADFEDLEAWVTAFEVHYIGSVDQDRSFTNQFNSGQFPSNVLVDTSTLEVVRNITGLPGEAFFGQLEQLLEEPVVVEEDP
ncbi:MAG: hypothetical protein AAGN82_21995 [Myxococcota bacterium]